MDTVGSSTTHDRPAYHRSVRNLLIDPTFQWNYACRFMFIVFLISSLASAVTFGLLLRQAEGRVIALVHDPAAPQGAGMTWTLTICSMASPVLAAAAVGIWSLLFSHRISGPLFAMRRWFAELENGRLPTIRALRQGDQLQTLHDAFRRAVESLRARKKADLDRLTEATQALQAATDGDDSARGRAIESLASVIGDLREETAAALGEEVTEPTAEADEVEDREAAPSPSSAEVSV